MVVENISKHTLIQLDITDLAKLLNGNSAFIKIDAEHEVILTFEEDKKDEV